MSDGTDAAATGRWEALRRAGAWLAAEPHLASIRDGVVSALPIVLVGSLFLLLAEPPLPALARWLAPLKPSFAAPVKLLTGAVALYVAFATAHALARRLGTDPLSAALVATAALLLASRPVPLAGGGLGIALASVGAGGIFVAILVALLTVRIQRALVARRWVVSLSEHAPEAAIRAFEALLPAVLTLAVVFVPVYLLGLDLHGLVGKALGPLLRVGDSLGAMLLIVLIDSVLWLAGIHPIAVLALAKPVWLAMLAENLAAVARGAPPPHIGTRETFLWFIWLGGSGLTLPLAALLLRARSSQLRAVGRVGWLPALFNINDAYLFGAPIVLNGALAVPFIAAPVVATLTTYAALKLGWVVPPHLEVLWTLPAPVGAFLSTRDGRALVLCGLNFLLALAIYYPFVRRYDRRLLEREAAQGSSAT